MSIHRESWHIEVASFEKQKELLFQQYSRGMITAEEFATKMLRLWKGEKGEGGLLDVAPNGDLIITPEWIYAHSPFFKEVDAWAQRWDMAVEGVNPRYLSLRYLAENVLADRDVYSTGDVQDVFSLLENEPTEGSTARENFGSSCRTEQEFEKWLQKTLETLRVLVERAQRHFSEDPVIQEPRTRGGSKNRRG